MAADAFNVITLEHAEAAGAARACRPVILQISENAVRFHGGRLAPLAAASRAVAAAAAVGVALHLDHVVTQELWEAAPQQGFGSFMVDASRLSYEDNVDATRAAAGFGRRHGLWVEAELGAIGGKAGDPHAPGARTDPGEAAAYVAAAGVDGLAVAVGSRHAMTSRDAALDHDLIAALRAAVPVPLVLHGLVGRGRRRPAPGGRRRRPQGEHRDRAQRGVHRCGPGGSGTHTDPRGYLAPARDAMADAVAGYLATVATAQETRTPVRAPLTGPTRWSR